MGWRPSPTASWPPAAPTPTGYTRPPARPSRQGRRWLASGGGSGPGPHLRRRLERVQRDRRGGGVEAIVRAMDHGGGGRRILEMMKPARAATRRHLPTSPFKPPPPA